MLKTNSKKARLNIQAYIIENFDGSNYDIETPATFKECARYILEAFRHEKFYTDSYYKAHRISEQTAFIDWCQGLPSILDTCYYYNRPAVDDLAKILEETPEEASKYSEDRACQVLTSLIYRELINA